jgi:hypothetical protein
MTYEKALEQLGLSPDIRLRQMFELGRLAAPVQEPIGSLHVDTLALIPTLRHSDGGAKLWPAHKAKYDDSYVLVYTTPPAQPAPTVQEPFGWWFTPNGEFLLPTEVEVDNPRDYETYRALYIDTPPPAQPAVPLTVEQINGMDYRGTLDEHIRSVRMTEAAHGITKGQP